ncbi:NADP-dependent oxidoreductase [Allosalinactinospora lopnorensis]|uniref:NADP-dependent oxidoreductase n=1 Tax=Allosalinactinospora lopnorensis TaxID=1352348 RepID=UPI000623BA97|nr:NADP-dependent oxidoreductase [Allosalinactinospora lopnorensis]
MKAIVYRRYGGPEVLEVAEAEEPKVGPDSVLLQVRSAAVNPVDWKLREGYLDAVIDSVFPVIPGWDVAGVVERTGVSVPEFEPGDEVIGYARQDVLRHGSYAEKLAAPVRTLARKPRNYTWAQAAGLPLAGLTAYQALMRTLRITGEDTVLIHAAAGGVGSLAVQLARDAGARVIGTASERNHDYLRSLGAEPVSYGEGLAERVRELGPVTAALDTVGGDALRATRELGVPGHRIASVADGEVAEVGGSYVFVRPDAADLAALVELAEAGRLTVDVAEVFPLEKAADAQRSSAEGHTRGKIVLEVA